MKLFLVAFTLFSSSFALAEMHTLPDAAISAHTLGGTVLMIQMKYSLVIDGDTQASLNKELGEETRKKLFKDLILNKEVSYLKSTYGSEAHQVTNKVIGQYEVLQTPKQKLSLN